MKIINSHYIPLPEPRWLIVDPKGTIYEQLGTMTIVADASKEKVKVVSRLMLILWWLILLLIHLKIKVTLCSFIPC